MASDKTDKTDETPCDNRDNCDTGNAPRVEILGGDGLHKRTRTWHGGDEGLNRVLDSMRNGFFVRELERQLAECDTILRELGYGPGVYPTDGVADPYTEAWYAGQVGWRCALVLQTLNSGRPPNEMTMAHIMAIGAYSTEWEWRLSYRPAILTGAKQRRHLTELREGKNTAAKASVAERREAVAALMRETRLTGGALDKWLIRQLEERHGIRVKARTIRDDRKALRG